MTLGEYKNAHSPEDRAAGNYHLTFDEAFAINEKKKKENAPSQIVQAPSKQ